MKGKQKASSLSVTSEQPEAVEWSDSEAGDEPSAMETAPIVRGGAADDSVQGSSTDDVMLLSCQDSLLVATYKNLPKLP